MLWPTRLGCAVLHVDCYVIEASAYLRRRLNDLGDSSTPVCATSLRAALPLKAWTEAFGRFQLEGGIHRYLEARNLMLSGCNTAFCVCFFLVDLVGEAFPDGGHFQGANFVFDKRAQMRSVPCQGFGACLQAANPNTC